MKNQQKNHSIVKITLVTLALIFITSGCEMSLTNSITEETESSDPNRYLDAVRQFADNVLEYGRDTYGPEHTPLFVDGVNVNTHEPVKWISPVGDVLTATETEEWILSNFASQQTLLRTLNGLSTVTGDTQYRDAAMQAIKYAFENLRAPNGLFYWGDVSAYDAQDDEVWGNRHALKVHYPYYELMWQVNPEETERFIKAFWSGDIIDWTNLDFNRIALYSDFLETPWNHEYSREPTFFESRRRGANGFFHTATSLTHAGTTLYQLSGQEDPLIWSKRLIQRFADTRQPETGISAHTYNAEQRIVPNDNIAERFIDRYTTVFPFHPFEMKRYGQLMYFGENWQPLPWLSLLLVGDSLGGEGREFTQWALEELTAWANASYRQRDNSFVPILTDGTDIEGVVLEKYSGLGVKGDIAIPIFAGPEYFWLYATAYRVTDDEFMWQMARDIAQGNDLGDIGEVSRQTPELNVDTDCSDVYSLLGFLELYNKIRQQEFLRLACRIADNIIETKFHQGFFVFSKQNVYSRFDCFEPLALLHLVEALNDRKSSVPRIWPTCAILSADYRYKILGCDRWHIYKEAKSSEIPWSLQEAAHLGDIDKVKSLINSGINVDSWGDNSGITALQRAAISGHKDVAEFLIAEGAQIDYMNPQTPLHYAVQYGHKDIVELLLTHGADINIENNNGQTPLDIALSLNRREIVELLQSQGVDIISIHEAAQMGNLARVRAFLEEGVDVNAKDENGQTPLHIAVSNNHEDIAKLLIDQGADLNATDQSNYTPLYYAIFNINKDIVSLLVDKGADVNLTREEDYTLLHYAVWMSDLDIVKLLVEKGAKFDVKALDDWTAFHYAVVQGSVEMVELFISKGVDTSNLHMAAFAGDLDRLKELIEQGTEVDTKDEAGWTALFWASSAGQTDIAEFLINSGADVNVKIATAITGLRGRGLSSDSGFTSLHQAAQIGEASLVELLVSKGADINAIDPQGRIPLYLAAFGGHLQVVEYLISAGADINGSSPMTTPLYGAILGGHVDVVKLLLDKGVDVNVSLGVRGRGARGRGARGRGGMTLLNFAEQMGNTEIAKLLREHGAEE